MNEICVIGTGLAGMTQALSLAQHDFAVTVIGPMPHPSTDERTTAILMPGIEFLTSLGLWQKIASSATKLAVMELVDQDRHLVFDAAEIGQTCFGYNISNEALKSALIAGLKASRRVTWHQENARQYQQTDSGWSVALDSGAVVGCDLLIGADGRQSPTRSAAKIDIEQKHIEQSAIVTIVQAEKPHRDTSVEWYLQGGNLTLVPMPQNRLAIVWCNRTELQEAKMKARPAALEKELQTITGDRFGALTLVAPLQLWPVRPMMAKKLVAPHCALIGEAAHVLAPLGAQGFNLSLHDIMALSRILQEGNKAMLAPSNALLLKRYEKNRLAEISARYHSVNALNTLLQSDFAPLHRLRRFSLLGIQRLPFIKRRLMHKGMTQKI